jgi:hypothetical protein
MEVLVLSEFLKNNFPKYEVTLPVSKKKIKFRPMTVREEKMLLLAQQSMSIQQMAQSMAQIFKNCCDEMNKPEQMPMVDAEMLFIAIRSKSMGEIVNFIIKCPETGEAINIKMDLDQFELKGDISNDGKIKLSDEIVLKLKQPTLSYFLNYDEKSDDELRGLFKSCFIELQTPQNIYRKEEVKESDLDEFYDYLTNKQITLISDFMNKVPRFKKTIPYTGKDGIKRQFVLFGIDSFFGYASAT